MTSFADFNLDPQILESLQRIGYESPTPVQKDAIPLILEGKDLIALAETGSGKTAACAIPVCDRVDPGCAAVQALILVPTRELATQYATELQKIGRRKGVKAFAIVGGEDMGLQLAKLESGVQVVIATPGRLIDLIYGRNIDLSEVETLILDEADEMLSMGFYDDLEFIIQCLIHKHQTLLFSATMPKAVKELAKEHMEEPHEVTLNKRTVSPSQIEHLFLYCSPRERDMKLQNLLEEYQPAKSIVFCRSRIGCEKIAQRLKRKFPGTDYLHGGLPQEVRSSITNKYRRGQIKCLVATDVAARGLDFSGVTHIFIYELPDDPEVYVHRSGRTGRSGKEGIAISLITSKELGKLSRVLKLIRVKTPSWIGKPPPAKKPRRRSSTKSSSAKTPQA